MQVGTIVEIELLILERLRHFIDLFNRLPLLYGLPSLKIFLLPFFSFVGNTLLGILLQGGLLELHLTRNHSQPLAVVGCLILFLFF